VPRDQPQPGSFLNKREEPGNEVAIGGEKLKFGTFIVMMFIPDEVCIYNVITFFMFLQVSVQIFAFKQL
jgi:hypothetical protein